jgi:hypothetical protein
MRRSGLFACVGVLGIVLAGCNHSSSSNSSATLAAANTPAKPAATADQFAWGDYLAAQGKLHGKDVGMHPYIYVIPAGDSVAANARRKEETDSVVHSIGPILMPGGMLILGGPDAKQTTGFVNDLAKQLKANVLQGIVVMVVSDPSEQAAVTSALKPSGATVRFVAM